MTTPKHKAVWEAFITKAKNGGVERAFCKVIDPRLTLGDEAVGLLRDIDYIRRQLSPENADRLSAILRKREELNP